MEGSSSTGWGDDGESAMEEPDEAWVGRHLEVERLDDEHGGGVAVKVASLAGKGAGADADVARTGAWLQAHGSDVKAVYASCGAYEHVVSTMWCGVLCLRNSQLGCVDGCSWLRRWGLCARTGDLGSRLHKLARGLQACTALTKLELDSTCVTCVRSRVLCLRALWTNAAPLLLPCRLLFAAR